MAMHHSDPKRETKPTSLPNVEVFYVYAGTVGYDEHGNRVEVDERTAEFAPEGWYYWRSFPGCLPDGEPMGPYETEAEALAAAREE